MKKIIIILSAALFAFACTQFEKETTPTFTANPKAPSIEKAAIPDGLDPDYSFAVKITPGSENVFYSFAVIEGGASAIDASTLLSNGYAGKAVNVTVEIDEVDTPVPLSGCFNVAEVADTTVVAFDLKANTPYTVYAVASGEKGVMSDMVSQTFYTTDSTVPNSYTEDADGNRKYSFSAAGLEDGTIVIDFGDPIELSEGTLAGTKKFHAVYQAANVYDANGILTPVFDVEIPVDSLSASGSKVSIQVPERIPGAVVSIYYDKGVVETIPEGENDALENPALTADEVGAYWSSATKMTYVGPTGRFETASWEIGLPLVEVEDEDEPVQMDPEEVMYFSDWEELAMAFIAEDLVEPKYQEATYNQIVPGGTMSITYTDGNNRKITYDTKDYAVDGADIAIALAEQPDYGSSVAVTIPEDTLEDIWGNPCEAYTNMFKDEDGNQFNGNYFFSYGYNLDDLYGTYTLYLANTYGEAYDFTKDDVIIAPRPPFEDPDSEEYYSARNVAIYNLFTGYDPGAGTYEDLGTTHYGTFNIHSGILNIEYEYIGYAEWEKYSFADYVIAESFDTEDNNYNFQQPKAGLLNLSNDIYIQYRNLGWVDMFTASGSYLLKTSSEYEIPSEDDGGDDDDDSSSAPALKRASSSNNHIVKLER